MILGVSVMLVAFAMFSAIGCRSGERSSRPEGQPTTRAHGEQPDEAAEFAGEDAARFNPPPGERPPPTRPRIDDRRAERDQPRIRRP